MTMKLRNVPFSPPDMTEAEAAEVRDAILSGWITTGPRTKKLEKEVAEFVGVDKAVCLNSQTACGEMALRLLGIGDGDEVIVPAYTYTASASIVEHVGAKLVLLMCRRIALKWTTRLWRRLSLLIRRLSFLLTWLVFLATTIDCLASWKARKIFLLLRLTCKNAWPYCYLL